MLLAISVKGQERFCCLLASSPVPEW
jgi:hypothetical protein